MSINTSDDGKYPARNIEYNQQDDILLLANGLPSIYEEELYSGCSVSYDNQTGRVTDIVIEAAKEAFLPILVSIAPVRLSQMDTMAQWGGNSNLVYPEISYSPIDDVLWLGNGLPIQHSMELFPECTVFFSRPGGDVSGIRFDSAKEMLLPCLLDEEVHQ